jgi:hypothetical protein
MLIVRHCNAQWKEEWSINMDKTGGVMGAILEQGKQVGQATSDQIAKAAQAATAQVTGNYDTTGLQSQPAGQGLESLAQQAAQPAPQTHGDASAAAPQSALPQETVAKDAQKDHQLAAIRQKLALEQHRETYYNPTFTPAKPQEERPVEKLEREDQEDRMKLMEDEKKKPQSAALQQATQRTEKFRGAGG